MAVKIRLSRLGKKNSPMYRIVVTDSRQKRDGSFIEDLGTYNPLKGELIQFHEERLNEWLKQGATLSDTVHRLQKKLKAHDTVKDIA